MKENRSLIKAAFVAALVALSSQSSTLLAQGTAFSFQGRLNNPDGTPANGPHDLLMSVYDTATGGGPIAGPLPINGVDVANGVFSTIVDFQGGVFTGGPRYLEMSAAPAGTGAFLPLPERIRVLASPYAIFAGTATNVAAGSVVKSLNGLKDDVVLQGINGVTVTPSGNTLIISNSGSGGGVWSLSGTTAYYNNGNVRVGPLTPASSSRFTISTPDPFGFGEDDGFEHTDGIVRLVTYLDGSAGYLATASAHPLKFSAGSEPGGSGTMTIHPNGNVGIGVTIPQAKLQVVGSLRVDGAVNINSAAGIALNAGDNPLISRGWDAFGGSAGSKAGHGRWGLFMESGSLAAGIPDQDIGYRQFEVARYRTDGTRDSLLTVANNGYTTVKVLTITGGADIAEPFEIAGEQISKGSVVVIDEEHPGQLKLSSRAYDSRVAGIVSGANGVNPGIALHQAGALDAGQNVALSGRVYVQADASYGPIRPGDLLSTSGTPGHAMKVSDHAKAQGAILGKAMGSLREGKGLVLVLVTLQ